MSVPGGSVGTAFITILPDTDKFVASLVAQMKGVSAAADAAGNEALRSSANWTVLGNAIQDAGNKAAVSTAGYVAAAKSASEAGSEALRSSGEWNVLGGVVKDSGLHAATSSSGYSILGAAADDAGNQAAQALPSWAAQATIIGVAGDQAKGTAVDYAAMAASADVATKQIDEMTAAVAASPLMRGGGIGGGPPGKGLATDLGSAFRGASNIAQGFLGVLTLIAPTINIIIAGLIGVVSLLGVAVIAAAGFAAALGATAAAMAFAAFKWRDLISQGEQGATTWQGALMAVEAQAFNMAQGVVDAFKQASGAGGDFWKTVAQAGVGLLQKMQPVIDWIVSHVLNFIDALNGVGGAQSPFLDFMRTWLNEWKVLGDIINQGISGGGGLLGFFEKYEKPAKAFVEGIAQVINGIRKMSAMGLGLNMDQLAEFIRNVFLALAQLITVFPKFSNSLVKVGLQVTRFILQILPIVSAAIEIGSAILEHIVAPIVNDLLVALQWLMNLPFINFLISLAGAWLVVAVAVSKLSFGLISFSSIVSGKVIVGITSLIRTLAMGRAGAEALSIQFPVLARGISAAWSAMIKFGTAITGNTLSAFESGLVGVGAALIVVAAAYFALRGPMHEVAVMSQETADAFNASWKRMETGAITSSQVLADTYNKAAEGFNSLSNLGKFVYGIEHFGQAYDIVMNGATVTSVLTADAIDKLKESFASLGDSIRSEAAGGSFGDTTVKQLAQMKSDYDTVQATFANGFQMPPGMEAGSPEFDAYISQLQAMDASGQQWKQTLDFVNQAYADGTINAGQYGAELADLYGKQVDSATAAHIQALEIEGATNTMKQALIEVAKNTDTATGSLAQFAAGSGQAFAALKKSAIDAINDPVGGLVGTGAKVTEFFQAQSDVIDQWKADTATAFNFVTTAFTGLADGAAVSFAKIKSTLQSAVQDAIDYGKNWDLLRKEGASQELLQQIKDLGQGGAQVLAGLVQGGKKGVAQVNRLVAQGASLSEALATNMADALNVTMDKVLTGIEVMAAQLLDIPFGKFKGMVDDAYNHWQNKTGAMKDKSLSIDVTTHYKTDKGGTQMGPIFVPGAEAPKGPAATSPIPPPDISGIKNQYIPAGHAAIEGMAAGLQDNAAVVAAAGDLGNASVKATAQSIGAASPATKFIQIGRDAVDGLIKGVSSATGTLTAQMTRTGNAMATAVQAGLSGKGLGANTIKTEFTATGTAAGEGLVRGLRRSLSGVVAAGKALGNRAANAIDIRGKYVIAGAAAGRGLAQGITRSLGVVIAAGKTLSNKAANTINIKGKYVAAGKAAGQGLAQGISDASGKVTAAASQIGVKMVKATTTSIGGQSASKFVEIGKSAIIGLASGVSRTLGTLISQMSRAGASMAAGLRSGLLGGLAGIQASAVSSVQALVNAVKQVLRSASPSRVFYDIGQNIAEGLRLGIGDGMKKVTKDMTAHAKGLGENFKVPTPKVPAIAAKIPAPKVPIHAAPKVPPIHAKIPTPPIHAKIIVPPIHAKIPVPTNPIHAGIPHHLRHPNAIDVPVVGGAMQQQQHGHRSRNEMRIRDWRTGLATLESELGWEDAVRTR